MEDLKVERLDHRGIISGVIKDLGIIEMIDDRIAPDDQEEITTGEAVAGMILNGLGFSQRPPSLTPQFFANKPLERLFREGVGAEHFNRFKLGRSLDKVFAYGCDTLFGELSLAVCQQEGVDRRFRHVDTTSFSLYGDYVAETDEQAIVITHGYSKDHRPDLKQAVLELMTAPDGGIPLVSQSWNGNATDNAIFQERAKALIAEFKAAPTPTFMVADSKLYTEKNAPFLTRIPESIQVVQQLIQQAWAWDQWQQLDETYRYQRIDLCHYGIEQRWLVITSQAAWHQAEQGVAKAQEKEHEAIQKQLYHFQAQRFNSEAQASTGSPGNGSIIRSTRPPARPTSTMPRKDVPRPTRRSRPWSGSSRPPSRPIRKNNGRSSNAKPVSYWAPTSRPRRSPMKKSYPATKAKAAPNAASASSRSPSFSPPPSL